MTENLKELSDEQLSRRIAELVEAKRQETPEYRILEGEAAIRELESQKSDKNDACVGEVSDDSREILCNPALFDLITRQEFDKKIVGEQETRKVIFLCMLGHLVENANVASYNLLINDDAGVGKDYVVNAVMSILPKERYVHRTRISPTAFTYWHNPKFEPEWTWNGKVFVAEDISEGVLNSDVFKVMCSTGSSATIVIKQRTYDIEIEGKPVMVITTATATPNSELIRRFAILNLDSTEEQTKLIMKRHSQFKKVGIVPEYDPKYTDALKYLKRVRVRIPFAELIDERLPTKSVIMRTNYSRLLDFISASAAFYQHQRKTDPEGYILAEGQDYDIARECFLKLTSNKYMIPLTLDQKKILAEFVKNPALNKSASELHASSMSFVSLTTLQKNLGIMVRHGILQVNPMKDQLNRDIEWYSLSQLYEKPEEKLELPTYSELSKSQKAL